MKENVHCGVALIGLGFVHDRLDSDFLQIFVNICISLQHLYI